MALPWLRRDLIAANSNNNSNNNTNSSDGAKKKPAASAASQYQAMLLGGVASMMAVCCTHPLDLLKVQLQTNKAAKVGVLQAVRTILRDDGVGGFYRGLSASLLRQMLYSTTRFAAYDVIKGKMDVRDASPLWQKMAAAMSAGCIGGIVGNPADVANVRMQSDMRLAPEKRRGYRHAFHALGRMRREEGLRSWYSGLVPNVGRAMLVTAGQLASYDEFKYLLLNRTGGVFKDNMATHFTASFLAGLLATMMSQPVDVIKTRLMSAPVGEYSGGLDCLTRTVRAEGPLALMKGFVPSFTRLGPHTVLTFMFLEQLRTLHKRLTTTAS